MIDDIREIKDHVIHMANLIKNSKNASLIDKVQVKNIEEQTLNKLDNMMSISPYGGDKNVKGYLTVGDVSKVSSIGMSSLTTLISSFSSLIFNNDKVITRIDLDNKLQDKKVINTFTEMKGVLKAVIKTSSATYGVVVGEDSYYHVADIKYWIKIE